MISEKTTHISNIYSVFGQFIKDNFFRNEEKGSMVFPIIDGYFVKKFCNLYNIDKISFVESLHEIKLQSINWKYSNLDMLGLIGIQLYAASKMEKADGYSSANYRERICSKDIFDIDICEWDSWARDNQDALWNKYYLWCSQNDFIIDQECSQISGVGRYVQYPKVHSLYILNREDLKSIAYAFVVKKIHPQEDLSELDFWTIIGKYYIDKYCTSRAKNIFSKRERIRKLAYKQIYQFFLLWDGEYTDPNLQHRKADTKNSQLCLYKSGDQWSIDIVKTSSYKVIKNVALNKIKHLLDLSSYHNIKRSHFIVFQRSEDYDNYWEEVRYIDNHQELGLVLCDKHFASLGFTHSDFIVESPYLALIKIDFKGHPNFYSIERPYHLHGGLKISTNTYIVGAPPLIHFYKPIQFWIDGIPQKPLLGDFVMDLKEGIHKISIQGGYKSIDLNMIKVLPNVHVWEDTKKWNISNQMNMKWDVLDEEGNVLGLDFESLSETDSLSEEQPVLTEWCRNKLYLRKTKNQSKNIVLSLLVK